jgi:inactivated superfamily I helicase
MLEASLDKLAQQILSLDEASLASLWQKYKNRMENFEPTKEWEKAVIVFFIINSVRAKNEIFNEQIMKMRNKPPVAPVPGKNKKPVLRLVKE